MRNFKFIFLLLVGIQSISAQQGAKSRVIEHSKSLLATIPTNNLSNPTSETQNAIDRIIDKVIDNTNFDLQSKVQQPSELIQSIDFSLYTLSGNANSYFGQSIIQCKKSGEYTFGFSSTSPTSIFVNNQKLNLKFTTSKQMFTEYAYDRFRFSNKFTVSLNQGKNTFLIQLKSVADAKFSMAALLDNDEINTDIRFYNDESENSSNWLICSGTDSIVSNIQHPTGPYKIDWYVPAIPLVYKLSTTKNATFKKHSYVEWHYSNGVTLWSILNYASLAKNKNYEDFVTKCCQFNLQNYDFFYHQFSGFNEFHGYNHRMFRLQMLDDTSAPALPYLKLYSENKLSESKFILKKVSDFVQAGQSRLSDGTLCRPEPWNETIWADDLFMSVPYLMLLGKLTGNSKYYDDAAFQVISFYKHLYDKETGLCRHAWVNSLAKDSIPYWSRANGWMIWATSEVLLSLPKTHKDYKTIQNIFKVHVDGLLKWQNDEGFLHQLINNSNSFTETSSTAMLTIALARGINQGWLSKKLTNSAIKSWNAVCSRIETDGNVKGICEGTSINTSAQYYLQRRTMDHDPRGLGAVITAGYEMKILLENLDII